MAPIHDCLVFERLVISARGSSIHLHLGSSSTSSMPNSSRQATDSFFVLSIPSHKAAKTSWNWSNQVGGSCKLDHTDFLSVSLVQLTHDDIVSVNLCYFRLAIQFTRADGFEAGLRRLNLLVVNLSGDISQLCAATNLTFDLFLFELECHRRLRNPDNVQLWLFISFTDLELILFEV